MHQALKPDLITGVTESVSLQSQKVKGKGYEWSATVSPLPHRLDELDSPENSLHSGRDLQCPCVGQYLLYDVLQTSHFTGIEPAILFYLSNMYWCCTDS